MERSHISKYLYWADTDGVIRFRLWFLLLRGLLWSRVRSSADLSRRDRCRGLPAKGTREHDEDRKKEIESDVVVDGGRKKERVFEINKERNYRRNIGDKA